MFKRLLSAAEPAVPQVEYVGVHEPRWRAEPARVLGEIAELGLPVFVKPAHLGSSMGIVRVGEPALVSDAVEQALARDELVIIEAMAPGIEVECGVLGVTHAGRAAGAGAGARALGVRAWRDRVRWRVLRLRGEVRARRDGARHPGAHVRRPRARGCRSSPSRRSSESTARVGARGLLR